MEHIIDDKLHIAHYGLHEMLELCATKAADLSICDSANMDFGDSWTFGVSYDRALEMASRGWQDKAAELEKTADRFDVKVLNSDTIERRDVAGEVLDVGGYLAGDPDHWSVFESTQTEDTGSRIVRIVADISTSAMISGESMMRRGEMTFALVRALERAGKLVQIDVCYSVTDGHGWNKKHAVAMVRVKNSFQVVDAGLLAFWFAHPAAFRRIMFRAMEHFPQRDLAQRICSNSYGTIEPMPEPHRTGAIYSGSLRSNGSKSDADRRKVLIDELIACGVAIDDAE